MQTHSDHVVADAFSSVVEQIAFMFAEPAEAAELPAGQPFVQASMSFDGPLCGTLTMAVPARACTQIAANVLGVEADEECDLQRAADSLKELLNVTCGHILTGLAGEQPVFDLSIPKVSDLDEPAVRALQQQPGTLGFLLDESPVLLRLALEKE